TVFRNINFLKLKGVLHLLWTDIKEREVVMYKNCQAKILEKKVPNKIVVRNLEFPEKGDWISAELDFEAVEKFEKSREH
ncbi:hypothetical protein ABWK24_21515, partial [Priestia megaterium]|uniref:hypothetical protein n=3 Tax=Priestia megaterium TaxID=1404 RepID=UPI003399C089